MATSAQVTPPTPRKSSASLLFSLLTIAGVGLLLLGWALSTYNRLVVADQEVRARWAQVESVYQRRAELAPRLVVAVQSAVPNETFDDVSEAVGPATQDPGELLEDPQGFLRYQAVQQTLSGTLKRLLALTGPHPELEAAPHFRELQAQLEGTENRIAIEGIRFNEAARQYNSLLGRFPTMIVARALGARFPTRPLFQADPATPNTPPVRF